jgi:PTS system beta-glucosides-specific IIC component
MEKQNKYTILADSIVGLMGEKENISSFTHCMTRLRFNVKDKGLVDVEKIEQLSGVVGTQWANDQLQIIVGQGVGDAYNLICEKSGLKKEGGIDENLDTKKKKFGIISVFEGITGCIVPLIPLFLASGLIKVLIVLGNLVGILPDKSSTYLVLSYASDAALYFMPIFVGYTAAKKFGADVSLAMGLCSILVYPNLVAAFAKGSVTIFGLPVYHATYSNMIFPSIMVVFVMHYVEQFFKKIMPEIVRVMMVPLCTILVMLPLTLCLIAPAGIVLGNGIAWLVEFVYNTVGFLGVGLLAGLYPLLIITGMHSTLAPVCISFFTKFGFDPLIIPACYIANFNQSAAAFAVAIKSKDKNIKGIASSASATAFLAGVTEPALFGVTFRYRTPLIASVIGGFVGGCYVGIMGCKLVAMSGLGVFALAGFLSSNVMNFVNYIIGTVLGMIVTFVITLILYKEKKTSEV